SEATKARPWKAGPPRSHRARRAGLRAAGRARRRAASRRNRARRLADAGARAPARGGATFLTLAEQPIEDDRARRSDPDGVVARPGRARDRLEHHVGGIERLAR